MSIAVKKIELIQWLAQIKDSAVIKKVEGVKKQSIKESYEASLRPMSHKAYKVMLDQSNEDYKHGRVISQKSLEKESENW